jgi:hypothetical protein
MGYEPPLDDDIALDKDDDFCDDCGSPISDDSCGEPDRMWGDE